MVLGRHQKAKAQTTCKVQCLAHPDRFHVATVTLETVVDLLASPFSKLPFLLASDPFQPEKFLILGGRLYLIWDTFFVRHIFHFEVVVFVRVLNCG